MHRTFLIGAATLGAAVLGPTAWGQQQEAGGLTGNPAAGIGLTQETPIQAGGGALPVFANMGTGHAGSGGSVGSFHEAGQNIVLGSLIVGQEVLRLDGRTRVGTVSDLILGGDGQVLAFVVDTGGKQIAVDPQELNWMPFEPGRRTLAMNAAPERIEAAQAVDVEGIRAAGAGLSGAEPLAPGETAASELVPGDPTDRMMTAGRIDDGTRPVDAPPQTLDGFPIEGRGQPQQIEGTTQLLQSEDQEAAADALAPTPGLTAENLRGMRVFGVEGQEIGQVSEVILTRDGAVEAFILDVGGFLGIGRHTVAVAFDEARFVQNSGMRAVQVAFTEDQLRDQPAFDAERYRRGEPGFVLGR